MSLLAISLVPQTEDRPKGTKFQLRWKVKAALHKWFQEKQHDFLMMEFKNSLNVGKSVLMLEEIMWKNDYTRSKTQITGAFIFCFT